MTENATIPAPAATHSTPAQETATGVSLPSAPPAVGLPSHGELSAMAERIAAYMRQTGAVAFSVDPTGAWSCDWPLVIPPIRIRPLLQ